MDVKNVSVIYLSKAGFSSDICDGLCHRKTLPWLSVVQSVSGSYDIQICNGQTFSTGDGGFFVAPYLQHQTIIHHNNPQARKMVCRWVYLDVRINGQYRLEDVFSFPVIVPDAAKPKINAVFNKLFASDDPFDELICGTEIAKILYEIGIESSGREHTLAPVLALIEEKYSEKLTVEMMAKSVNLSESRFYVLFKQQLGVSPIQYLNAYRMSIAAQKLTSTDKTVKEIAFSVGIEDNIYFNKLFKKVYNMSPVQYRKVNI